MISASTISAGEGLDARLAGVEVPWNEALVRPPFAIEVVAKAAGDGPMGALVGFAPLAMRQPWQLQITSKGELMAALADCQPWQIYSGVHVDPATWHRYGLRFDGQTIELLIDGKAVRQLTTAFKPALMGTGPLVFGTCIDPGSSLASGARLAEVRFSRGGEIVGHWRLNDQPDGAVVQDVSGNAHDGVVRCLAPGVSLDELDAASFNAGASPLSIVGQPISIEPGTWPTTTGPDVLTLDGVWDLACGGEESHRLSRGWDDCIPAVVPGSVHGALLAAKKIPDPTVGLQDAMAREQSHKTWWLRRTFTRPSGEGHRLAFQGVANHCTVWLNAERLGDHVGMFGGPSFDLAGRLKDHNTLVVKIEPVPRGNGWFWDSNDAWRKTVTFNCCYGWHYTNIPALGIWRPVEITAVPAVRIASAFVAAKDVAKGVIRMRVELEGNRGACKGRLQGVIEPENFTGHPHRFNVDVARANDRASVCCDATIPDAQLWWPNGLGEPNLYRLRLTFLPEAGGVADAFTTTFGLRTIEMRPLPQGPHGKQYNWTPVINGRAMFVKGTGWCTMDALMDFRRERYERFLSLARQQHCQMVRAWGGGMPETDDFYDLCDRLGLMVMQEWPTAWNSHDVQPFDALEETVRLNTIRLRNHPSLVIWGAGNESSTPHGPAIDMMGRLAIELDGTRPFHRGEAWGGSDHNYDCWWGNQPLDHNLTMTAPFWGEFGLASLPVWESLQRYLPDAEKHAWPPPAGGSFEHHTPVFNRAKDVDRLKRYAGYFTKGVTMRRFIAGSQLAQAVGVRHTLERSRTRWPACTGALMYKLNDLYPAASWSTVDWYGATKLAHWFVQDAFAPLHACVLFDSVNLSGDVALPVFLLDDADTVKSAAWSVQIDAYDESLRRIRSERFSGHGAERVNQIGRFKLAAAETRASPLFVIASLYRDSELVGRTFYFVNYEQTPDSLFDLPQTTLQLTLDGEAAIVKNVGLVPAVGVTVQVAARLDRFTASDNCFWLNPGESRAIQVSHTSGLTVTAWNLEEA